MTYKVPEWDDTSNDLLAFDDHAIPFHFKKGGPDVHQFQSQHSYLQQQRYSALRAYSTSALVPIVSDHLPDSVTQPKMQSGDCTKSSDGLECSPICSPNSLVPLTNACAQEDEMLSWLRYPLADSPDRSYCSEVFGELMNPTVQLVKDVFLHQSMKDSENSLVQSAEVSFKSDSGLQESKHISGATSPPRTETKSDAAMALGAGRAAGRLSQIGSEAFNGVRTQITPNSLLKSQSSLLMESVPGGNKTVQLRNPLSASSATSSAFNFSLFSRPLATTMDNLHVLGVASGPTNTQRARQPLAKDLQMPSDPYITDSNRSETISLSSYQQSAECGSQGRGEQSGSTYEDWCSPSNLHCKSYSRRQVEKGDLHSRESCISVSETALDVSEATEAPVSPSYLSGNSSDKVVQEVTTPSKHALPSAQHSEQPDVEDAAANARKPPPAPRSSKRSRAAEVHNESEKKRRNKLNVRLKLLQSLIPNSNKTDKASVLDEAIEYTKMLQAQVQFMSMKTGMFFPTMMHSGMQFVPVEQLPAFSHLGMGMGMGMPVGVNIEMGVGLPLADANVANTIGVGIGVAAGAGAGAGPTTNLSPMSHQEHGYAWAGPQRVAKSSCLPIYDSSGSLPIACQPYRVNMAQQPLQPMIPTIAHMNADLYSASRQ